MADDLRIRSSQASSTQNQTAPATQTDASNTETAELERLRSLAQQRGGGHLNDRTLLAIARRGRARAAANASQSRAKQAFESAHSREQFSSAASALQAQAKRTTGALGTRGADGLTDEERTQVRSDANAPPKIPAARSPAITPEQARPVLERMFANAQLDNEPFDLETYAQTLRPKSPAGAEAGVSSTGRAGQSANVQSDATGHPGRQPDTSAAARVAVPPAARQTAPGRGAASAAGSANAGSGRPARMPDQPSGLGPGLGPAPRAAGRLAFRAGGATKSSAGKADGQAGTRNAGGGLRSERDFNGMTFNWDAFFFQFLIRTKERENAWRSMMRELQAKFAETELAGMKMQEALLSLRNNNERERSLFDLTKNAWSGPEMLAEARAQRIRGLENDSFRLQRIDKELREITSKLAVGSGRRYLGDEELERLRARDPEAAERYQELIQQRRDLAGSLGHLAFLYEELRSLPDASTLGQFGEEFSVAALEEQLEGEITAALEDLNQDIYNLTRSEAGYQELLQMRQELNARRDSIAEQMRELQEAYQSAETEAERTQIELQMDRLYEQQREVLRTIVVLDAVVAREGRPLEGEDAAVEQRVEEERARQAEQQPGEQSAADSEDDGPNISSAPQMAYLNFLQDPDSMPRAPFGPFSKTVSELRDYSEQEDIQALSDAIAAGDVVWDVRRDLLPNDKLEQKLDTAAAEMRRIDGEFAGRVNRAVHKAVGSARANAQQLNGVISGQMARAQNMANQLLQLLGLMRSM